MSGFGLVLVKPLPMSYVVKLNILLITLSLFFLHCDDAEVKKKILENITGLLNNQPVPSVQSSKPTDLVSDQNDNPQTESITASRGKLVYLSLKDSKDIEIPFLKSVWKVLPEIIQSFLWKSETSDTLAAFDTSVKTGNVKIEAVSGNNVLKTNLEIKDGIWKKISIPVPEFEMTFPERESVSGETISYVNFKSILGIKRDPTTGIISFIVSYGSYKKFNYPEKSVFLFYQGSMRCEESRKEKEFFELKKNVAILYQMIPDGSIRELKKLHENYTYSAQFLEIQDPTLVESKCAGITNIAYVRKNIFDQKFETPLNSNTQTLQLETNSGNLMVLTRSKNENTDEKTAQHEIQYFDIATGKYLRKSNLGSLFSNIFTSIMKYGNSIYLTSFNKLDSVTTSYDVRILKEVNGDWKPFHSRKIQTNVFGSLKLIVGKNLVYGVVVPMKSYFPFATTKETRVSIHKFSESDYQVTDIENPETSVFYITPLAKFFMMQNRLLVAYSNVWSFGNEDVYLTMEFKEFENQSWQNVKIAKLSYEKQNMFNLNIDAFEKLIVDSEGRILFFKRNAANSNIQVLISKLDRTNWISLPGYANSNYTETEDPFFKYNQYINNNSISAVLYE